LKRQCVFLRKGCVLPGRLDPVTEPFSDNWKLVEEITAPIFDTMIRQAGWHSMWMPGSCSRRGFGRTQESATHRALAHALDAVPHKFNAAELDSVHVAWFPGFCVANATLLPREIMQSNLVEFGYQGHPRAAHAR
jgi:hypothetical protein